MAITTNYTDVGYVAEVTEGTTPASPAFQLIPTTGGSVVANIATAQSQVIRQDRQTDDLIVTDLDLSGDLNYELSYAPYKPLLLSLMQNTVTRSIAITAATANGTGSIVAKASIEATVAVGDVFTLTSAADPALDGVYTCIDNTTTAGQIVVYPDLPAATVPGTALDVVITATTIVGNGATTPDSYTFRKRVINGGTTYYWYHTGCKVNSMNFSFATGSILTGALNLVGMQESIGTTAIAGESTVAVPAYDLLNSVSSVGAIYVEGEVLGTASFTTINLTVDNQTTPAKAIGTLGAIGTNSMSLQVTASVEIHFADLSLYTKFKNSTGFSMTMILSDASGNSLGINLPNTKFETLDTPVPGIDQHLMQSGTIRGLRDLVNNEMIKLSFIG